VTALTEAPAGPGRDARPARWPHLRRGIVQDVVPAGVIDLGPGYPDPDLLPTAMLRQAYGTALGEYGPAALAYGHNTGPLPLREALADRARRADGHPCEPDNVLITAGTSQALHLLSGVLGSPGGVVLADQYSYDLGRQIFTDSGLRVRTVAMDADGMNPLALREAVLAERAAGARIAFVYLNPTHHNPTGIVVPLARRRELLDLTEQYGLMVVEDDAYGELALDSGELPPPSLAALAGYRGVLKLGTFAKTLAPGLRLGWLLGEPALVRRIGAHGLLVSGGSLNHTTSLAVATTLLDGSYGQHLEQVRGELRRRRDTLAASLKDALGPRIEYRVPPGGFFLWLGPAYDPERGELKEADLAAAAELAGVRLAAGSRFGSGARPRLRLAYSLNPPELLTEAAHRLAAAWTP
jgi:enduracididine biosynthesis enzyme MppQ